MQSAGSAFAQSPGATAFVHANLVPMTSDAVLADRTVIVEGRHIAAIGPSGQIRIAPDTNVIDCRGAYLMPGLADMHMHLRQDWTSTAWPVSPLHLYLASGVTTIRCFGPGGRSGRYALAWRQDIDAGRIAGPRILTCGPALRGHFHRNPEEIVIQQKYQGFDFIKIYSYVTRREFHTILATAKQLGIYTAGHIPFPVGLDGVLAEGMDEIAHIEEFLWEFSDFDRRRYFESEDAWMTYAIRSGFDTMAPFLEMAPAEQEHQIDALMAPLLATLAERPMPVCTTLVVDDVIVEKLFHPDRFLQRPENRYLPAGYLESLRRGREKHQRQFQGAEVFAPFKYRLDQKLLAELKAMDICLLLATDAGSGKMGLVPGFSVHDELDILVANGFTPYEAIRTGTVNAAGVVALMGRNGDFGTIETGKRADLILVTENPLEDVAHIRGIVGVMAAGRWYDAATLQKMLQ
jgi:hypothetical protein